MDQIKIGKFIAQCRKDRGLTQMQLAETLGITDRAVSKWETGKAMPDSAIMLELCDVLGITVNDLLNGELVSSENYAKKLENHLLDSVREKEMVSKYLFGLRIYISVLVAFIYAIAMLLPLDGPVPRWLAIAIATGNMVAMFSWMYISARIKQVCGYYKCSQCGHTHVPDMQHLMIGAFGKTANLPCPQCEKNTAHTKVFSKEQH